jgi:hypothetical protein
MANNWAVGSESDSWSWNSSLNIRWRPSGRMNLSLGPFFNRTVNDLQWVDRFSLADTHYLFGEMDQRTFGLTGRLDFTFKPDLTLQVYGQPFVSAAHYREFKRVDSPGAERYGDRFSPVIVSDQGDEYHFDLDGDGSAETLENPDFNFKQFRSTVVLRWEYRPGSLLYLVWSQGRDHFAHSGDFHLGESMESLFRQDAENVFMLKMSYWIAP